MNNKHKLLITILAVLIAVEIIALVFILLQNNTFAILDPKGVISTEQRNLIILAVTLAAIVLTPVFAATAWIAWKFRSSNPSHQGTEETETNLKTQLLWWTVPLLVILVLAPITWASTHRLDPRNPIESDNNTLTIEVIALQWKWLFIYPEEDIATVNFFQIPVDTPIKFKLTAEAPMNSFWIPQLGGQMYAMAGMGTELNLMAKETGEFFGQSAEISGDGFSAMKFTTKATSAEDFDTWVKQVKLTPKTLDDEEYGKLAQPSGNVAASFYSDTQEGIYNKVILKFAGPDSNHGVSHD